MLTFQTLTLSNPNPLIFPFSSYSLSSLFSIPFPFLSLQALSFPQLFSPTLSFPPFSLPLLSFQNLFPPSSFPSLAMDITFSLIPLFPFYFLLPSHPSSLSYIRFFLPFLLFFPLFFPPSQSTHFPRLQVPPSLLYPFPLPFLVYLYVCI